MPDLCQGGWHRAFCQGGQGPQQWWWHCPLPTAGYHPQLPSGWGPSRGKAPQCNPGFRLATDRRSARHPPPPSPAGAATSVVVANTAPSSGHSCASQRPASPTRSQTPQLHGPDPSPPARPASQAARSPWLLAPLRLPGPLHPAPSPIRPVPPWPSPLGGPRPLHTATPALGGAPQEGGGGEEGGQGRGELALLLVNAPRAGAKNRGGEIFRRSQDAFGRRRERGREGAGGGEERGRKERERREKERKKGGLGFQI